MYWEKERDKSEAEERAFQEFSESELKKRSKIPNGKIIFYLIESFVVSALIVICMFYFTFLISNDWTCLLSFFIEAMFLLILFGAITIFPGIDVNNELYHSRSNFMEGGKIGKAQDCFHKGHYALAKVLPWMMLLHFFIMALIGGLLGIFFLIIFLEGVDIRWLIMVIPVCLVLIILALMCFCTHAYDTYFSREWLLKKLFNRLSLLEILVTGAIIFFLVF